MTARQLCIAAMIISASGVVGARQGARYTARRETVRIDALITRNGRPVTNLHVEDFDVYDNGVRQTVDFASLDALPMNVILALDMSRSVAGERLAHLRQAAHAALGALKTGDQAGLVTFSASVAIRAPLGTDVSRVMQALDRVVGSGDTSLVDGTYASLVLGDTDLARSLVIVCSDGVDSSSFLSPAAVLDTARRTGAVVYALVDGEHPRPRFLDDVTAATGGSLIPIATGTDLDATFVRVLAEFRQRYVIAYSPAGVSKDGWHRVDVRLKGAAARGVTIKARPGYQAGGVIAN